MTWGSQLDQASEPSHQDHIPFPLSVQSDKTSKPKKATINWLQKFFHNQGQEREARDALIASKFYDQIIPSSTVSADMEKS